MFHFGRRGCKVLQSLSQKSQIFDSSLYTREPYACGTAFCVAKWPSSRRPLPFLALNFVLILVLFLVFAIASSFDISNYLKSFVYISFAMSLNVLLISTIEELKSFVRENRSFSLIIGLSLPFYYAAIRIILFPNVF